MRKKPAFIVKNAHAISAPNNLLNVKENGGKQAEGYCSSAQSWVGAVTVCRGSDLAASGAANGVVRLWAIESDTKSIRPLYDLPLALGRDNRGRVRGLGMGVSKFAVHHSTPYRRYEMASQAAIKTAVDELKEQNIQLRERLEEESRERKRMEKRILSYLSHGQTVMQPSTDNSSSSQVRHDLPPQDARSCMLMHLTRKSTCIAYGRVRGLSTEEEECYKVIVDEIIEGSVELMGGGKSFQDLTLGDTIDWPIFRTTFV